MGIKQNDIIFFLQREGYKKPIMKLQTAVSALNPGDKVVLLIYRGSSTLLTIVGTLGQSPGSAETEQNLKPLEEVKPAGSNIAP